MSSIYEILYQKITSLVPGIEKMKSGYIYKLKAIGFPDIELHLDNKDEEKLIVTLLYNYTNVQNDWMVDRKCMTIMVSPKNKSAEAISSQNKGDKLEVYPEGKAVDEELSYELNARLNIWLNNLKSQGYNPEGSKKGKIW